MNASGLYARVCGFFNCHGKTLILARSIHEAMDHAAQTRCKHCGMRSDWNFYVTAEKPGVVLP